MELPLEEHHDPKDHEAAAFIDKPEEQTDFEDLQQIKKLAHEQLAVLEHSAAITGFSLLILSFLFLSLKLDGILGAGFLWGYCTFPLIVAILIFSVVVLQYYVDPENNTPTLARNMIFVISTTFAVCGILFSSLIALKADGDVAAGYDALFAPVYVFEGVAIIFVFFLLPGLLVKENKKYKEALLLMVYAFGTLAFTIMYDKKLEGEFNPSYFVVIIPLLICFGIHAIALSLEIFDKDRRFNGKELFGVALMALFVVSLAISQHFSAKPATNHFIWSVAFLPAELLALAGTVWFSMKLHRTRYPKHE